MDLIPLLLGVGDVEDDRVAFHHLDTAGFEVAADRVHLSLDRAPGGVPRDLRIGRLPDRVGIVILALRVELDRGQHVAVNQLREVRLGLGVRLVHHLHFLAARDVDQLRALRNRRADVQVASLRHLVHGDEPVTLRIARIAVGGHEVPHVELHRDLVDDERLGIHACRVRRQLPLGDRALDVQRGVRVAFSIELRVQRAEADGDFHDHRLFIGDDRNSVLLAAVRLAGDGVLDLREGEHRARGLELAGADHVLAARVDIHPVRALSAGQEEHDAGHLRRVEHGHAADLRAAARLCGGLGRAPVHDGHVIAILLRSVRLELAGGPLRVVGRPERPVFRGTLPRRPKVPVERRRHDLPPERHRAGRAVDPDARDGALELRGVVLERLVLRAHRHREAGGDERILGILRHHRGPVIAHRIGNRAEDLLRLEIAQIDACDAVVAVVVHEEPAAVVVPGGLRERGVMDVAPGEAAEHRLRFLVEAVPGSRIRGEDRNRRNVPHRRHTGDEDLAGMPAGIEEVVLVEVARLDVARGRGRLHVAGRHRALARGFGGDAAAGREARQQQDRCRREARHDRYSGVGGTREGDQSSTSRCPTIPSSAWGSHWK